jgi:hypothetical protein
MEIISAEVISLQEQVPSGRYFSNKPDHITNEAL